MPVGGFCQDLISHRPRPCLLADMRAVTQMARSDVACDEIRPKVGRTVLALQIGSAGVQLPCEAFTAAAGSIGAENVSHLAAAAQEC